MEYIYGALLLHKLGKEITESELKSVVAAAGVHADESKVKSLVASLKGVDIAKELENATLVAAAPASGSAPIHEKKEEKPKEEKAPAAEGLSALFG
ncbi:50S ribosomal protein P1 [Candidatus Pacearchaeota archaeon]|nr:50S ribosomal protein P1 [Candidatus Pacearchaeota archaeon]